MSKEIYWHAPLWEVLCILTVTLVIVGWLAILIARPQKLTAVLNRIDPALNDQPLFHFTQIGGLRALNTRAAELIAQSVVSEQQESTMILVDVMSEVLTENRHAAFENWPEESSMLIAVPFSTTSGNEAHCVLATVLSNQSTAEQPIEESTKNSALPASSRSNLALNAPAKGWVHIGSDLAVHDKQPIVRVKRQASGQEESDTRQEERLTYLEESLLRHLVATHNQIQRAEDLFRIVWPDDEVDIIGLRPDQRDRLRRLVYQLRRRIEPEPRKPRYLQTAHGIGYALYGEIRGSRQGETENR